MKKIFDHNRLSVHGDELHGDDPYWSTISFEHVGETDLEMSEQHYPIPDFFQDQRDGWLVVGRS